MSAATMGPDKSGKLGAGQQRDYLSFSAIRAYQVCPLRYYFRYIANLPEESVAAAFVFGTSVHRALEFHFRELQCGHAPPNLENLIEHYRAGWLERTETPVRFGKAESRQALDDVARGLLRAFAASSSARPAGRVLAVEETLRGRVIPGLPEVLGRIDLITETNAELVISDWKTSRSRWNSEQVQEASEQLLLYAELARDYAHGKRVQLEFVVLTKTKEVSVEQHRLGIDPLRVDRTKRVFESVWRAIDAKHFYPAPSPLHCPGCPYRQPCQQWSG